MVTARLLARTALASIAALGIPASAFAQQESPAAQAASSSADARATDGAILEALLKRREEVARGEGNAEGKRAALAFLDRQIADIRRRLESR